MTLSDEYSGQLWRSEEPKAWLRARGIDLAHPAVVAAKLGFVREPQLEEHQRYRGSIVIPYFDARGRERRFRFRNPDWTPDWPRPKYDEAFGSKRHLYGVEQTTAAHVFITEGEFDALILRQLGLAAVGVSGAMSGWTPEYRWLFRDCDTVTVVMDADPTGEKGSKRIVTKLAQITTVRHVELPAGRDVSDLYMRDPGDLTRRLS